MGFQHMSIQSKYRCNVYFLFQVNFEVLCCTIRHIKTNVKHTYRFYTWYNFTVLTNTICTLHRI